MCDNKTQGYTRLKGCVLYGTYRLACKATGRSLGGYQTATAVNTTHIIAISSNSCPTKLSVAWKYTEPVERKKDKYNKIK